MASSSLYSIYKHHPIICTDTRAIQNGCIFFALKGEKFNGNAFAQMAIDQGAAYAVVSDPDLKGDCFIHVDDTLKALQDLAREHRNTLSIPVIAITGSNGKTTTKELTATVLSGQYKVHATRGNLNNHIGVPLTVLELPSDTEIFICEMGANHQGEIKSLCEIAKPTHGVITNIGKAHLEGFGSIEGVKKAKGELFDYLHQHNGFAFVNADDAHLVDLSSSLEHKCTYAIHDNAQADVHFSYIPSENQQGFSIRNRHGNETITATLFGDYNAINMVAAYAIAQYFNVDKEIIARRLSAFESKSNRSEVIRHKGYIVVKDAYNANPSSMELAIKAFAQHHTDGCVLLGDMKELGSETLNAHRYIIEQTLQKEFKQIWFVGPAFREAAESLPLSDPRIKLFNTVEEAYQIWNWPSYPQAALLLKGSRSMRLEKILD